MKRLTLALFTAFLAPAVYAQDTTPTFVRDNCVKLRDGKKAADYRQYLHDVPVKLNALRAKEGHIRFYIVTEAVVPAGSSAPCDYHLSTGYTGFPSEPASAAELATEYAKANIAMDREQALARRDELVRLVSVEVWRISNEAGGNSVEGGYLRRNYYKMKPGHTGAEFDRLERSGWKPFAEAFAQETKGVGWRELALTMPAGERLHYQAMTLDIFPGWKAVSVGNPTAALWPKVHPNLTFNDYIGHVNAVAERYSIELYKNLYVVRAQ